MQELEYLGEHFISKQKLIEAIEASIEHVFVQDAYSTSHSRITVIDALKLLEALK